MHVPLVEPTMSLGVRSRWLRLEYAGGGLMYLKPVLVDERGPDRLDLCVDALAAVRRLVVDRLISVEARCRVVPDADEIVPRRVDDLEDRLVARQHERGEPRVVVRVVDPFVDGDERDAAGRLVRDAAGAGHLRIHGGLDPLAQRARNAAVSGIWTWRHRQLRLIEDDFGAAERIVLRAQVQLHLHADVFERP